MLLRFEPTKSNRFICTIKILGTKNASCNEISALKTKEKLEAKERNKKIPKKPFANVEKKISYKDYKILNKLN